MRHRARGRIAKSILLVALLAAVQIGLVRQVQWVRGELSGLSEIRIARRRAMAEAHRLERELTALCRPDVVADRARNELGLKLAPPDELLFAQASGEPHPGHYLPPCVDEVLRASAVVPE